MTHYFESDGLRIAYDDLGEGEPILLLHGFAADRRLNWRTTGWYDLLVRAGFRVIAADARGHGQSAKPSDPEAYRPEGIAGDTIRLMSHLGLRKANLFGYSMGGRNAGWLLQRHPARFLGGIIGGAGLNLLKVEDPARWEKRGFRLTADNRKTRSLAIPSMEKLYQKATAKGGRLGLFQRWPTKPSTAPLKTGSAMAETWLLPGMTTAFAPGIASASGMGLPEVVSFSPQITSTGALTRAKDSKDRLGKDPSRQAASAPSRPPFAVAFW